MIREFYYARGLDIIRNSETKLCISLDTLLNDLVILDLIHFRTYSRPEIRSYSIQILFPSDLIPFFDFRSYSLLYQNF